MRDFIFRDLFIYDLANNHQGDVEHGLGIIRAMGEVSRKADIRGAFKFQFRELDTFIHSDYKKRDDLKHIPRFLSTRLTKDEFFRLTQEVRQQRMVTMATPFDEPSVEMILELGIEVIKIASCSAKDRPLLEYVAEVNRPMVISTAGLSLNELDRLVSFLEYKRAHFALMHCVAIYPTPKDKFNLNQIEMLRKRYPNIPIGFSTHENPEDTSMVQVAYAKGARLFERHVGIPTAKYKLNAYSSTPQQMLQWIEAYRQAVAMCGGEERFPAYPDEIASLQSLMRGVFAQRKIQKGEIIKREDVSFCMPFLDGQLNSGQWFEGIVADRNYQKNEPLDIVLADSAVPDGELIYRIMLQVKGMLNDARIFIGPESSVEISHHYGLKRFREFGCVIVTCINREYCKKLIIQLPRQKHPYHHHKKKEETFQLLSGDLEIVCEGKKTKLEKGETFLIEPGQWHKFHTLDGAVFEEVSTTHYNDDSFYEDEQISRFPRKKRKTVIHDWETAVSDGLHNKA